MADDVMLTAEYIVRRAPEREPEIDSKYGPFYNARAVDARDRLTVPARLYDVSEVDVD